MRDITELFVQYREAVRHLWNASFRTSEVDWDTRDRFSRVATELFTALVLERVGVPEQRIANAWESNPHHLHGIAVSPKREEVPISVNRDANKSSGYWDDPVSRLARDSAELRFVNLFDFDELGPRDLEYVQVRIVAWPTHPHLVTRYALLDFRDVHFLFVGDTP